MSWWKKKSPIPTPAKEPQLPAPIQAEPEELKVTYGPPKPQAYSPPPSSPSTQVLLAHEDDPFKKRVHGWLMRAGYGVLLATNGSDALSRCESAKPEAIILQESLPGGGAELVGGLEANGLRSKIKVIFLAERTEDAGSLSFQSDFFIRKPENAGADLATDKAFIDELLNQMGGMGLRPKKTIKL
jgi:CheY-like chemotaxis protein